jgi:raffinose/stachyose/melibiose transport system substrate-binding protein
VAQLRAYGQLQPLIAGGNLTDLSGNVPGLEEFDPTVLEGAKGKEDGKVYGVPFATQVMQVFYNKAIFEEQGIEVPETWDDFMDANDKLQKAGITPLSVGGKDAWMMPFIHDIFGSAHYGGESFRKDLQDGTKDFTDPTYVESIQTLKDLQGHMPQDVVGVSYADSQILFVNEQAAMFPGGSFELGFFQKQNPDLDLGVFQVPVREGSVLDTPVSPAYADGSWGINAASDKQEASLELVQWMASKEFGQLVADELKQFSPVPGVTFDDPVMNDIWSLYQENPAPYLMLVDFRYGQPLGTDLMGTGVQELFLADKEAKEVGGDIQEGVSQWFTPGS